MDLKSLDWNTVIITTITTTISTLIVGLILAIIGYFIWKKQHTYQKRLEVYSEIMPYLIRLKGLLLPAKQGVLGEEERRRIIEDAEFRIKPLQIKFIVFFSEKYRSPINGFINIFKKVAILKDTLSIEEEKEFERCFKMIESAIEIKK